MPVNKDFYMLAGSSGQSTGYTIDQSIRFNDNDSAYMHRTPSSGGNRDKWTWSAWVKRGELTDANATMFHSGDDSDTSNYNQILFNGNSGGAPTLKFNSVIGGSTVLNLATTQYFRDVSAWYHIVVIYDSGNVAAIDRARIYLNGARITSFGTETYPTQNQDLMTNHTVKHSIGRRNLDTSRYMDGYMTDIHLLDGYAYGPEYFGEFDDYDNWIPKQYSGSYGTNGFKIDGRDSSDLGDDESGNGNDYTTSGLAANDQVSDSPTNNFPTFNSIYADVSGINSVTLANGNLQGTGTSGQFDHKTATFNLPQSGKWYFEYYLGGLYTGFGICIVGQEGSITGGYGLGNLSTSQGFGYQNNSIYNGSSQVVDFGLGNRSAGDIMSAAIDVDNDKVYIGINNTYIAADGGNDGNPSSGANPTVTTSFSLSTNDIILGFYLSSSSSSVYLNFGQEGTFAGNKTAGGNSDANGIGNFLYSVPTNYLAICSQNLFSRGG